MKKFMKRCLILILIFIVLGTVLGIAGSTVAGRTTISQVVETVTGGRVSMELEDWDRFGFTVGDSFFGSIFGDHDEPEDVMGSKSYDTGSELYDIDDATTFDKSRDILQGNVDKYLLQGDIQWLDVDAGGCFFETATSDDGNIYLEAENAHKFQGFVEEGILYIKATNGSLIKWSDISDFKIRLYLPEGWGFDRADISMGAGKMEIASLKAQEAFLEVGAGQIIVKDVLAGELELTVGAGEIELQDMAVSRLDVTVGMGQLVAQGAINESADIECSMGNVDLEIEGSREDFNYQLEGAMGNISLGKENFSGFSQERTIDNGADKDMEVNCPMGIIMAP